jgi:cell division protein FtsB
MSYSPVDSTDSNARPRLALWKKLGYATAAVAAGAYAWTSLTGPSGIAAMGEKRALVRRLQEENADLRREVERRRVRIQKLTDDRAVQELEIRNRLKYLKEGEHYLVLPPEKPAAPAK